MNVLLISSNIARTPFPIYPLGMSVVAAALHNAGHEVCQFDFLQCGQSMDVLSDTIKKNNPDIIGISIRNIDNVNILNEQRYIEVVRNIVQIIRQRTDVPVVLGGSGFTIMPETILRETGADYGIVGEGECSMLTFVNNAARGVYPDEPCIRESSHLQGKQIPSAYYDPSLMEFYMKCGGIASVQTKRGCTDRCVYCSYPLLEGSTVRYREPQAVVNDIQLLVDKHKARYIFFADSVFNDSKEQYLDLLKEMKSQGVHVPWGAFLQPSPLLDDEKVALMKQTGLKAAEIGSDAPTDRTLQKLGKSFSFNDISVCNDLFIRHGIATAHYFMFGCPGETKETVLQGIANIKKLQQSVSFIFMGIRIFPFTPLAEIALREGILSPDQELLKPVYYSAPGIDRQWLEKTLHDAFSGIRHCVFPPDSLDSNLEFLHKRGLTGPLWDMLIPGKNPKNRRRGHGKQ